MALDYAKCAREIFSHLGGCDNLVSAAHCATRLRLVTVDNSKINTEALENVEGVKGVFSASGQLQIILGTGTVNKVYDEFIAISAGVAFALTWVFGYKDAAKETSSAPAKETAVPAIQCAPGTVYAPVSGAVIPSEQIPDETFAAGVLGRGVGIQPSEGIVAAPFDGEISSVTDTQHAVGISSPDGMEILIHVGVDTAAMNGDGFQCFVQEGQQVKAGEKLISFDRKKIAAAGHPDVVVVLVTNAGDYEDLTIQTGGCKALEQVIRI